MRIPQVLAQESVAIAQSPRIGSSFVGQGEAALGQGLLDVSRGFERIAQAQEVRRKSEQALEGFSLLMDARLGFDDAERSAKQENDHKTYEGRVLEGYQRAIDRAMSGTRDPEVQGFLNQKLQQLSLEGQIKARTYATELYVSQGKATMDRQLGVARDMIVASQDPVERERLTTLTEGAIRAQIGKLYKADEAESKIHAMGRDLQEAQALTEMQTDPSTVGRRLLMGGTGFEKIAPDTRARMATQAFGIAETRERKETETQKRNLDIAKDAVHRSWSAAANQGELSPSELTQALRGENPYITPDQARTLTERNDNPVMGGGLPVRVIMDEYHAGPPTLSRVLTARAALKHLESTLTERTPLLDRAYKELQVEQRSAESAGRAERGVHAAEITAGIQWATESYKAQIGPTLPGMIGQMQRNQHRADENELKARIRKGADPAKALEEILKKRKTKTDALPEKNKGVLDLVK